MSSYLSSRAKTEFPQCGAELSRATSCVHTKAGPVLGDRQTQKPKKFIIGWARFPSLFSRKANLILVTVQTALRRRFRAPVTPLQIRCSDAKIGFSPALSRTYTQTIRFGGGRFRRSHP